MDKFLIIL